MLLIALGAYSLEAYSLGTSREHFNVNVVQGTIVYKISRICQMLRYIFTMPMSWDPRQRTFYKVCKHTAARAL